jgi:hypothetical protein
MRMFGWISALGVLLVALVAGVVGYNLGLGANIAASGVTPVAYPMYGWGFGFGGFFGFFFFILIIFLIFGLIRRAAWGGRHHGYGPGGWKGGGYGPGGWGGGWRQDAADNEFQRWHRRAHGEPEEPTTNNPGSTTPPTTSTPHGG